MAEASLNLRLAQELKDRVQAYGQSLGLTDNAAGITLLDMALRVVEAEQRAAKASAVAEQSATAGSAA